MREIKCPHCGEVFTVNEDAYASIASQVRNTEFDKDVHKRLEELKVGWQADEKSRLIQKESEYKSSLSEKDRTIQNLENQVKSLGNEKDLQYARTIAELNLKIQQLEGDLTTAEKTEELKIREAKREEREKAGEEFKAKEQKLNDELEIKQREIDRLENYKLSQSTKMVGESLEKYCHDEFEKNLRPLLPNAYFEKDNEAVKEDGETKGSKGDFIFRDKENGVEYISIMFEMKNESDATSTKHENADFFDKLDKDRKKKNCDYAVLVSMLEQDSELYNRGIVDVSYKYPKMYVVRPQFFVPIITLLMNAEKRNVAIRQQLQVIQNDDRDFAAFEDNVRRLRDLFDKHRKDAGNNFDKAIASIQKSIDELEKVKGALELSKSQLGQAEGNLDDMLDIKKVAKNAPSIQAKLEEAKRQNDEARKAFANPDEQ